MKALADSLASISGGKVRKTYPVLTTFLLEMGSLKDLDCAFDESQLHDLLKSQGQVTTPMFMSTPPLWTDVPVATLYITVDWELGTYDVYRVEY